MGASKQWTEEEDKILEEYYPIMGINVAEKLPGRSVDACRYRACMFGITSANKWTYEDDEILKKYYPSMGGGVHIKFNGRHNINACYTRASILGIRKYNKLQ